MQVYEGYFGTDDRFITYNVSQIPMGKRAIVTILDEPAKALNRNDCFPKDSKAFWIEFDRLAAASSNEVLQDEDFPRINSSRKLELV
jgi:hypothetical protein